MITARSRDDVVARLHAEGWRSTRGFALLDATVRVTSDAPDLVDLFEELYAATVTDRRPDVDLVVGGALGPDGPGWFVARDGVVLVRTAGPTVAFEHLVFEANQQAIQRSTGVVRLHASAVAGTRGAVVCAGAMQAGKSTLAAGLVRRGLDYLTDEVAALTVDGRVRPYAKPISLGRPPSTLGPVDWAPAAGRVALGASGLVPPSVLGTVGTDPVPVGLFVLPRYRRDAPTVVRELTGTDAVTAVAAHAFHLEEPGVLAALVAIVDRVPCIEVESGSLPDACDAVLARLDGGVSA